MSGPSIDATRLLERLRRLGAIGRDGEGRLCRLAGTDADKEGRDQLVAWFREAGLVVAIDRVGNIFGIWPGMQAPSMPPLMIGSHIDTVIDAGIYDGAYGVMAALEVVETLSATGFSPARPIAIAAFTNEEGVRFTPDMMGSLVYAGGLSVEEALAAKAPDGPTLGAELARIGYAGPEEPRFLRPWAYLELHIEQGPVLAREGIPIGAVENLQGISWQRVVFEGEANHAGTTPMSMRVDAGHAAARVITFLRDLATASNTPTVATVGSLRLEPDAVNVIPCRATFTIDLRDPDEQRLRAHEARLADHLAAIAEGEGLKVSVERLARFEPVTFDAGIVRRIEASAEARGLRVQRMTSGAGHDAQMIARIAPAAMIFVPSIGGISHNPREETAETDLIAGASVLLDVVRQLASE